jgi:hypothetical protein
MIGFTIVPSSNLMLGTPPHRHVQLFLRGNGRRLDLDVGALRAMT